MILPKKVFLFVFSNDTSHSLQLDEEWRAVERTLSHANDQSKIVFNLTPEATQEDLFEKFNRFHNQIFLFHYGGHSDDKSLSLKGKAITDEHLATLLRQEKHLKLVFLNGCSNVEQVKKLFDEGIPAALATSAPINDTKAAQLAIKFYAALTAGRNIKNAFETAAAFINDNFEKGLVEYRGLGTQSKKDKFPWGLYVQDTSVLDWKISAAEVVPPPQKNNRGKILLLSLLLLLVFSFGGWLVKDYLSSKNSTISPNLPTDSLTIETEELVHVETEREIPKEEPAPSVVNVESKEKPTAKAPPKEKKGDQTNNSTSMTTENEVQEPNVPAEMKESKSIELLLPIETVVIRLGEPEVDVRFETLIGKEINSPDGKPIIETSNEDGLVQFEILKTVLVSNKSVKCFYKRPNEREKSTYIAFPPNSIELPN